MKVESWLNWWAYLEPYGAVHPSQSLLTINDTKTAGLLQMGGARKESIKVVHSPSGAWPAGTQATPTLRCR